MKTRIWIAAIATTLFATTLVGINRAQACDKINVLNSSVDLGPDPQATVELEIERNNTNRLCDWYIGFNQGSLNDGTYNRFLQSGIRRIGVQIYNESQTQILMDTPDATYPNNVLTGTFTAADGLTKRIKFKYVLGNVPYTTASGTYQNAWQIRLFQRKDNQESFALRDTQLIGAFYKVDPRVDLSLTDSGQPFNIWDTTQTLDFGTISQNEQLSFDMKIGNNRPYKFTFSSANNGKLKRVGGTATAPNLITYQTTIGSTPYSQQVVISNYPYSSATLSPPIGTVLNFPVTVRILDNPVQKNAGNYEDVVTITLTAQ